jgi:hypothetical protein
MEAQELFTRSGLDQGMLHQVWELSDADKDSYLSWPEFVLAMHLVRRARTHVPLPQGGLPNELVHFLGSVEPPQALAAQHSAPASRRSLSPATSAGDASWGPSAFHGRGQQDYQQGGDPYNTGSTGMPSFGTQGFDSNGLGSGGGGFDSNGHTGGFGSPTNGFDNNAGAFGQEGAPSFGFEGDMGSPKSKKDKRRHKHDHDQHYAPDPYESRQDTYQEPFPEVRNDPTSRLESRMDSGFDFSKPSSKHRSHHDDGYSPDFGQKSRRGSCQVRLGTTLCQWSTSRC